MNSFYCENCQVMHAQSCPKVQYETYQEGGVGAIRFKNKPRGLRPPDPKGQRAKK